MPQVSKSVSKRKAPPIAKQKKKTRDAKKVKPASSPKPAPMQIFRQEFKAAERAVRTVDGYDNFLNKIGLNNDNSLSGGTYEFNLLTRNRIKLEQVYRGSWVAGAIIDYFAEDMTRAGIDVTTARDDGSVKKINSAMTRLGVWRSLRSNTKWSRLYGGGLGVIQIEGQDVSTPLDIETIGKGQFKGIVSYDRWQLNPIIQDPILFGPDCGLPSYYQIVNNPAEMTPGYNYASIEEQTVHHSRCIRQVGIELPYFQAITEQMWGESLIERLWDRLISFDNTTMSAASLVDRANLRTVGVDGLREIIGAGGAALQGLLEMFEMMRLLQVNEGLTLIDKEDTFATTQYTFSGLSDVLLQFSQQLSGAGKMPLVRLFGQSPAGLGATGESEMRMYYDNINAEQESQFRNPVDTILRILWMSELGKPAPDDMEFTFKALWQMSATDKANNAKTTTETILGPYENGITDRATTLSELKNSSSSTGVFSNITDEMIDEAEAEADEPPLPGEVDPSIDPIAVDPKTQPAKKPVKSLDEKARALILKGLNSKWWKRLAA